MSLNLTNDINSNDLGLMGSLEDFPELDDLVEIDFSKNDSVNELGANLIPNLNLNLDENFFLQNLNVNLEEDMNPQIKDLVDKIILDQNSNNDFLNEAFFEKLFFDESSFFEGHQLLNENEFFEKNINTIEFQKYLEKLEITTKNFIEVFEDQKKRGLSDTDALVFSKRIINKLAADQVKASQQPSRAMQKYVIKEKVLLKI
jgi:hypothetical protein